MPRVIKAKTGDTKEVKKECDMKCNKKRDNDMTEAADRNKRDFETSQQNINYLVIFALGILLTLIIAADMMRHSTWENKVRELEIIKNGTQELEIAREEGRTALAAKNHELELCKNSSRQMQSGLFIFTSTTSYYDFHIVHGSIDVEAYAAHGEFSLISAIYGDGDTLYKAFRREAGYYLVFAPNSRAWARPKVIWSFMGFNQYDIIKMVERIRANMP